MKYGMRIFQKKKTVK